MDFSPSLLDPDDDHDDCHDHVDDHNYDDDEDDHYHDDHDFDFYPCRRYEKVLLLVRLVAT